MTFLRRGFLATVLLALLAGCASTPAPERPKLIVFLMVDGMPQRQVTGYREQLAPDGFARFLDRGAWFSDAHYAHAVTATAPGHATVLTGAYPHRTGIINNEWVDAATGQPVYNTGDTAYRYIGNRTKPLDGTSPRNLKAETLGDVLRGIDPASRVIAISGKDRGAILPAGHKGTAYMYMGETGEFASTTYYMPDHPAWAREFNARKPANRFFKTEWKALLPDSEYKDPLSDGHALFGPRGGKLPMMMGAPSDTAPGPAYYGSLLQSPFADVLALEFAKAAIAGEQLGRDDAPDILAVSLSGHDYVNHRWSAESRLSHDHVLHLDRMLQDFFRHLDDTVGKGRYVAVFTADHGFTPAPELSTALGRDAGRLPPAQLLGRINSELERRFGVPRLAKSFSAGTSLLLDRALVAQRGLDLAAVTEAARAVIVAEPGIAAAYTRAELNSRSRAGAPFFDAIERSWHKDVSPDLQFVMKPWWLLASSSGNFTTHGSPHPTDTNVPILFYGPPWIKPGRVDRPVEVADIAPTLARLLKVPAPSSSEGKVLPLP